MAAVTGHFGALGFLDPGRLTCERLPPIRLVANGGGPDFSRRYAMFKPVPDPPDSTSPPLPPEAFAAEGKSPYPDPILLSHHFTAHHAFGPCVGDMPIFAVREGMPLEEVLVQASSYLRSASAGAAELVENCPEEWRALARNVEHVSEIARALVEAAVAGLPRAG